VDDWAVGWESRLEGLLKAKPSSVGVSKDRRFGAHRHRAASAFVVVCYSDPFARRLLHHQFASLALGLLPGLAFPPREAKAANHSKSAGDDLLEPGVEQDLRATI
jgi:hypothetical protein